MGSMRGPRNPRNDLQSNHQGIKTSHLLYKDHIRRPKTSRISLSYQVSGPEQHHEASGFAQHADVGLDLCCRASQDKFPNWVLEALPWIRKGWLYPHLHRLGAQAWCISSKPCARGHTWHKAPERKVCGELPSHTILYYTILYYTILYYTILYYTILYYTILYYSILSYTTTILYYTIQRQTSQSDRLGAGPAR